MMTAHFSSRGKVKCVFFTLWQNERHPTKSKCMHTMWQRGYQKSIIFTQDGYENEKIRKGKEEDDNIDFILHHHLHHCCNTMRKAKREKKIRNQNVMNSLTDCCTMRVWWWWWWRWYYGYEIVFLPYFMAWHIMHVSMGSLFSTFVIPIAGCGTYTFFNNQLLYSNTCKHNFSVGLPVDVFVRWWWCYKMLMLFSIVNLPEA